MNKPPVQDFTRRRLCFQFGDIGSGLSFTDRTIILNVYCDQMNKLNAEIYQMHPVLANRKGIGIVFHHDNTRLHTSLQKWQKSLGLGWGILLHLPYSADVAHSDFCRFRSLQNSLNRRTFNFRQYRKFF